MSRLCPASFAIPGDIETLTGGYIYERRLLESLRALGHPMRHVALPAGFPHPSEAGTRAALAAFCALPPQEPLILDGLVFGSIAPEGLAAVKAPLIAMLHHPLALESGLQPAQARALYESERRNLARAAHVLVPSPHTATLLVRDYGADPGRITIVPPGVDPPRVPPAPAPAHPPLILSVGILHPRKGHDILIAALEGLADLDWRAVIAGNPWDHDHAEALAARRAASPEAARIRLAGRVPEDELQDLYAEASIFALATRFEGYGIVFDEALMRGLPIVSTAVGAVPDTVPPAAGLLVPPEDPPALAAALRLVLTEPARRAAMAAAAREAAAALPRWSDSAAVASAVLERVVASPMQPRGTN